MDMEFLTNFVECSICLDKFEDPKMLKCGHHFCRKCLEDIIKFSVDGSATIICPMRCPIHTVIGIEETLNNLPASYEVKGILDALKQKDPGEKTPHPLCNYDENCTQDIVVHCCETMMCKACFANHEKSKDSSQHRRKLNLIFSERQNQLNVICENHSSPCTHLCMDNTFLCLYCLSRDKDHNAHMKNTIERDVELIREALVNDSREMKEIYELLKVAENNILQMENKLDEMVKARKTECLSLYNDLLEKEGEVMRSNFQLVCDSHMKKYSHISPDCYQATLQKSDIELAIHKETILNTMHKNVNKASLDCVSVSLSESFDYCSLHPLGDLEIIKGEEVSTPVPITKSSTSTANCFLTESHTGSERKFATSIVGSEIDSNQNSFIEQPLHVQDVSLRPVTQGFDMKQTIAQLDPLDIPIPAQQLHEKERLERDRRQVRERQDRCERVAKEMQERGEREAKERQERGEREEKERRERSKREVRERQERSEREAKERREKGERLAKERQERQERGERERRGRIARKIHEKLQERKR